MNRNQIEELKRLADSVDGTLTEDVVISAAADPGNPLHSCFDWDDQSAAHKYRRVQARAMIRRVKITVETTDFRIRVPAYVRDPDADAHDQGYASILQDKTDEDRRRDVLVAEFARAAAALDRAHRIARFFGLQDEAKEIQEQLSALHKKALLIGPESPM